MPSLELWQFGATVLAWVKGKIMRQISKSEAFLQITKLSSQAENENKS